MRERREYYVYMLRFQDGSYYTGVTNSIEKRMWQYRNNRHPNSYVNRKGAFNLVRVEMFEYVLDAIGREKQMKRWSRKKKDALVNGNWEVLPSLARKDFTKRKISRKINSLISYFEQRYKSGSIRHIVYERCDYSP